MRNFDPFLVKKKKKEKTQVSNRTSPFMYICECDKGFNWN